MSRWKKKFLHGFTEYLLNFIYLMFVFSAFHWYRRLVLAGHQIEYLNYGVAIIEALVLAKVIMIGDVLRIGRRFENMPLIIPTIYRTLIFSVWVMIFKLIEILIKELIAGKDLTESVTALTDRNIYLVLAWCLMTLSAFIPFFAVKVLGRTMGEGKLFELFFKRRKST